MDIKLFDSEIKVMDVLWREGDSTAKCISGILKNEVAWNKNTTYTLIKRCLEICCRKHCCPYGQSSGSSALPCALDISFLPISDV